MYNGCVLRSENPEIAPFCFERIRQNAAFRNKIAEDQDLHFPTRHIIAQVFLFVKRSG